MKKILTVLTIIIVLSAGFAIAQDDTKVAPTESTVTDSIDTSKYAAERADLITGYNQLNQEKIAIEEKMRNIIYTIAYMNAFEEKLKAEAAAKDSVDTEKSKKKPKKAK